MHLHVYTRQLSADRFSNKHQSSMLSKDDKISATPASPPLERIPVMVFFHGGAFMFGSNTKDLYGPDYLLRKDVVLVVVNYRLNAFGKYRWLCVIE